jgi:plastocyanin
MKHRSVKISIITGIFSILLVSFTANYAVAESVPEWIKNNALWYGQGDISESEFLNAIKFLINSGVIILDTSVSEMTEVMVVIPNGNFDVSSSGFYLPLNQEIRTNTKVVWANEDSVPHNIQSQDEFGKISNIFNSPPLNTGDRFEYTFDEAGVYNYYCSFHPWRVGVVTVK